MVLNELTQCSTAAVSYFSIDPVAPIWLWAHPQLERKDISLTNHEWFCFFNPSVGFETWRTSAVMMLSSNTWMRNFGISLSIGLKLKP